MYRGRDNMYLHIEDEIYKTLCERNEIYRREFPKEDYKE
jgi:hypothetical protein